MCGNRRARIDSFIGRATTVMNERSGYLTFADRFAQVERPLVQAATDDDSPDGEPTQPVDRALPAGRSVSMVARDGPTRRRRLQSHTLSDITLRRHETPARRERPIVFGPGFGWRSWGSPFGEATLYRAPKRPICELCTNHSPLAAGKLPPTHDRVGALARTSWRCIDPMRPKLVGAAPMSGQSEVLILRRIVPVQQFHGDA